MKTNRLREFRRTRPSFIVVEDGNEEEPITVTDDQPQTPTPASAGDNSEITIENPTPDESRPEMNVGSVSSKQESVKHNLASRLYKAIETAYGSVYELTEVLNEIGRGYKAPALKGIGNASLNLQSEIEGMPGLLDGKHEKEDINRFMGLMDEITNG